MKRILWNRYYELGKSESNVRQVGAVVWTYTRRKTLVVMEFNRNTGKVDSRMLRRSFDLHFHNAGSR